MSRTLVPLLAATLLLAGCASNDKPDATSTNPYANLYHSPIRGLSPAEITAIENGEGGSRALAAELNGYPGPKHSLDLAERLGLNESQRAALTTLRDETVAEAKAVGADLLNAYRTLDQALRQSNLDEDRLDVLLSDITATEGELNFVHMAAHLKAKRILTPHQLALYMEFRGYEKADHADHTH